MVTPGLTLIAGQLLLLAPEEDAFWIFISIMDAHIRPYFSSSPQFDVDAALFGRALESIDAVLAKKVLAEMSISPNVICRPWSVTSIFHIPILLIFYPRFTSLFVGCLPPEHLNRVWDIFLLEGNIITFITFYAADRHYRRCSLFTSRWSRHCVCLSSANFRFNQRTRGP